MKIPRLLIAGTHSGVGKTTVTMGLIQALIRRGFSVQPFKAGPDYIDPGYHTAAADRPCRNLDSWLIPPGRLLQLFSKASEGASIALIEGVMGLYDGMGAVDEKGSTAELAKRLQCPVLLVLDASALSRSAAAIVKGYVELDPGVTIVGCVVNRVGGPGHFRLVKEGIERLTGIPVVGYLPRDDRLLLPERHLGLVPSQERKSWRGILGPLAERIRQGVDLDAVIRLARRAPSTLPSLHGVKKDGMRGNELRRPESLVPIGVAMDEAFHFYYPENLELLAEMGAEVVPFSPLKDRDLPSGLSAIYIGGGFPEVYAAPLARNRGLFRRIRQSAEAGMPIYAECGGLMVLTDSITDSKGRRFPMAGLLPGRIRMTDRLQNFGYKELTARRNTLLSRIGERARGHEFHHSVWEGAPAKAAAYQAASPYTGKARPEGYARGNLLASYVHLHFFSSPRWVKRLVDAARDWDVRNRRRG